MAISLKHKFQSTKPDSADTTLVRPSNWNDEHDILMATGKLLGRYSSGTGVVQEIGIGAGLSFDSGNLKVSGLTTDMIPHITGSVGDGFVRLNNGVNSADVGGSLRLTGVGTFTYNFDGVEIFRVNTGGSVVATGQISVNGRNVVVNDTSVTGGNGMTGGGDLTQNRVITMGTPSSITNSTTNNVGATTHTHALGFLAAGVHTSLSNAGTNFPIGHLILCTDTGTPRNNTMNPRLFVGQSNLYTTAGSGDALDGTWCARGAIAPSNSYHLAQRIA